jgi:hypothetical protein
LAPHANSISLFSFLGPIAAIESPQNLSYDINNDYSEINRSSKIGIEILGVEE